MPLGIMFSSSFNGFGMFSELMFLSASAGKIAQNDADNKAGAEADDEIEQDEAQ